MLPLSGRRRYLPHINSERNDERAKVGAGCQDAGPGPEGRRQAPGHVSRHGVGGSVKHKLRTVSHTCMHG